MSRLRNAAMALATFVLIVVIDAALHVSRYPQG